MVGGSVLARGIQFSRRHHRGCPNAIGATGLLNHFFCRGSDCRGIWHGPRRAGQRRESGKGNGHCAAIVSSTAAILPLRVKAFPPGLWICPAEDSEDLLEVWLFCYSV